MAAVIGPPPAAQPKTRKRKSQSCTQCRSRKKLCDRRVPGCNQCVLRGEAEHCRWGDERDVLENEEAAKKRRRIEASAQQINITETLPILMQSPASQIDESTILFDTLSRADIDSRNDTSSQSLDRATPRSYSTSSAKTTIKPSSTSASHTPDTSHNWHSSDQVKLSCDQASQLVSSYREQGSLVVAWIDTKAIYDGLEQVRTNDISDMRQSRPDLFALITMICASSLILMPATYTICMGLIDKSAELAGLLDRLEEDALSALDEVDMFAHPTLIGLQAMAVYQINLSPRTSQRMHIARMDEFIRACRRMGLDRLGSAQDDERIWMEEDTRQAGIPSIVPSTCSGFWAGDSLLRRDRIERTRGRAIWSFAVAKEWVSSRISSSCNIDPHSFTTIHPTAYSFGKGGASADEEVIWSFMMRVSKNTYKYFNLCAEAQALGRMVDYDKILELDSEIMHELERRPDWLKAELCLGHSGSDWRTIEAIMLTSTLYNRMFGLHRPFLALSRTEPERYGLSSSRSFDYAMLCIRIMKDGSQHNILMLKQLTFHFRLLQAALVVITHLFLGHDNISMKETVAIHQDLMWAISTFKQMSIIGSGSFFHSQGEKLEVLLAKAARLARQNARSQGQETASAYSPLTQMTIPEGQLQKAMQEDFSMSNLDEQLLRLSHSWPLATEPQDNNQLWNDLFLMLDNGSASS